MEENIKFGKEVSEENKQPEIDVEKLKEFARQLSIQNDELRQRLANNNATYIFTVLDFMLRLLDNKSIDKFPNDFVEFLITEIRVKIHQMTSAPEEDKNDNEQPE